ncbi:monoglyceride lipase [Diutina catenulata]
MTEYPYTAKNTPQESTEDFNGATFKIVRWAADPQVPYLGKVFYVHGFAEQSDVYVRVFDQLASAGIDVFFFGQRGAGETSPDHLGKTDEFNTFNDLDHFLKKELDARKDPQEKFVLAGHSMGGGIVLNYGIRGTYRDQLRAVYACGPLVQLHPKSQPNVVLRTLQGVVNQVAPSLQIDSGLKFDYVTSDDEYRQWMIDKKPKLIGTVRQYNDMFARGKKLTEPEFVAKWPKNLPLVIVHGTDDFINDIKGSRTFAPLVPKEVDFELYEAEKGRHSLFIEKEEIFRPVADRLIELVRKTK